jgi:hypothetical protein
MRRLVREGKRYLWGIREIYTTIYCGAVLDREERAPFRLLPPPLAGGGARQPASEGRSQAALPAMRCGHADARTARISGPEPTRNAH